LEELSLSNPPKSPFTKGGLLRVSAPEPPSPMKNPKSHDSQTEEELILEYVRQNGSISNAECRNLLNVDRNHAFYLLNKMRAAGLLTCQGSRRWARYSLY